MTEKIALGRSNRPTILILDDVAATLISTKQLLNAALDLDLTILTAQCPDEGLQIIQKKPISLVILDLNFRESQLNGFQIMQHIQTLEPDLPVIILSADYDIEKALKSHKLGAVDYIVKDSARTQLPIALARELERIELKNRSECLRFESKQVDHSIYIPKHPIYEAVYEHALSAAADGLNLLIQGDTGTGKGVLARHIRHTLFSEAPFIQANCGGCTESLVAAEYFGSVKGLADSQHPEHKGYFEQANGGILFLDEVGNAPEYLQRLLLKVLDDKVIRPVMSEKEIPIEFQLISASNAPLDMAVRNGDFRRDLFNRINQVVVTMPSLSEIPEVIPELCEHFLSVFNAKFQLDIPFSDLLHQRVLENLDGNYRCVENTVRNYVRSMKNPSSASQTPTPSSYREREARYERSRILNALMANCWNKAQTARQMGLKESTLKMKIKKLDLDKEKPSTF